VETSADTGAETFAESFAEPFAGEGRRLSTTSVGPMTPCHKCNMEPGLWVSKSRRNVCKGVLDLENPKRYRSDVSSMIMDFPNSTYLEYKTTNFTKNATETQSELCFEK
jgi:hypothetical protein